MDFNGVGDACLRCASSSGPGLLRSICSKTASIEITPVLLQEREGALQVVLQLPRHGPLAGEDVLRAFYVRLRARILQGVAVRLRVGVSPAGKDGWQRRHGPLAGEEVLRFARAGEEHSRSVSKRLPLRLCFAKVRIMVRTAHACPDTARDGGGGGGGGGIVLGEKARRGKAWARRRRVCRPTEAAAQGVCVYARAFACFGCVRAPGAPHTLLNSAPTKGIRVSVFRICGLSNCTAKCSSAYVHVQLKYVRLHVFVFEAQ